MRHRGGRACAAARCGAGDWVRLTDPKGRRHNIRLEPGEHFHTQGLVDHDDLIGGPEGFVVTSTAGGEYLAVRPLLGDYVLSMPRGAAVVYPKDAAQIVAMADIYPGARVVEAGVGSGALTCRCCAPSATAGCRRSSGARTSPTSPAATSRGSSAAPHPAWPLSVGDLSRCCRAVEPGSVDRVVLDMLAPWENLDAVADALAPGGVFFSYVATTTQLSRLAETLRAHGRVHRAPGLGVDGARLAPRGPRRAARARMIGHTGFLLTTRRLAAGRDRRSGRSAARRRGAYGVDSAGPRPVGSDRRDGRRSSTARARRDDRPSTPRRGSTTRDEVGSRAMTLHGGGTRSVASPVPIGGRSAARELRSQVAFLEAEVSDLRRRLADAPGQLDAALEQRLADTERSLAAVTPRTSGSPTTLRAARDQIIDLKEEVDRLAKPPPASARSSNAHEDGTVDIFTGGRKMRVAVSPASTSTTCDAARRSCSTRR